MTNLPKLNNKLEQSVLNKLSREEVSMLQLAESKKFEDYNNDDKQQLAKSLVGLSYFVGIKEPPSAQSLVLLVKFMCQKFPTFSSEELENAFMKVCAGELGNIDHFQNLSPVYIGKIIKAYEEEKHRARRAYIQQQSKKEWEELEKQRTIILEENIPSTIIDMLTQEFITWLDGGYSNLTLIKTHFLNSLMTLCNSYSLFIKYDPDKFSSAEYFEKYFLSLPTDKQLATKEIRKYVRSYGKNIRAESNEQLGQEILSNPVKKEEK